MTARRRVVTAVLVGWLVGCSSASPTPPGDEVDQIVLSEMAARKIPGLALLVRKGGKVVKLASYGKASLSPDTPATVETIFPLFSITKTFTAVGVMKLVEEGKLGLDDPIGAILDDLPESWRAVTVRQCLNHTSGLPDVLDLSGGKFEYRGEDREEALRRTYAEPIRARPGEECEYNQTGYILLGRIVEARAGRAFAEYMRATFFEPLRMTSTAFGNASTPVSGRAAMYDLGKFERVGGKSRLSPLDRPTPHEGPDNPRYNDVGANLNSTVGDLARWDEALGTGRLLRPETMREMWTVPPVSRRVHGTVTDGYACGWRVTEGGAHPIAHHGGGDCEFYSRRLDDSLTIVVLSNAHHADVSGVLSRILAAYENTPGP